MVLQAGWTIPLYNMLTKLDPATGQTFMPVSDCNNYVRSTSDFFAESCAVNTLTGATSGLSNALRLEFSIHFIHHCIGHVIEEH